MSKQVVILGPTASGKSSVAMAAAQQVAAKSSAGGEEAIADSTDAGHIEPNPFNMADGEEVQVV